MDQHSFSFQWEEAGLEQCFFFDDENSEVAEVLFSFHDDSDLPPFDTIFQNDIDPLMVSSSSANVQECLNASVLPSPQCIYEQPPPLFQQGSFFFPSVDATAVAVAANASSGESCCTSAQSVAARQRRKRISEKTRELSRLIPGGTRMTTAQMLQAGFQYLKFLQAQVLILDLMASFPECKSAKEKDLQVLLASPTIQQRLSTEGLCVMPEEIVEMVDGLTAGLQFKQ